MEIHINPKIIQERAKPPTLNCKQILQGTDLNLKYITSLSSGTSATGDREEEEEECEDSPNREGGGRSRVGRKENEAEKKNIRLK